MNRDVLKLKTKQKLFLCSLVSFVFVSTVFAQQTPQAGAAFGGSSPTTVSTPAAPAPPASSRTVEDYDRGSRVTVESSTSVDAPDVEEAAFVAGCGWRSPPSGRPIEAKGGEASLRGAWNRDDVVSKYTYRSSYEDGVYDNPACELFILQKMIRTNASDKQGRARAKARCELIRNDVYTQDSEAARDQDSSSGGGFSALGSFFDKSNDQQADNETAIQEFCDNPEGAQAEFACSYMRIREKLDSAVERKRTTKALMGVCRNVGADMTARLSASQYNAMVGAGVDAYGNACYPRGGNVIIQQAGKNGWDMLSDSIKILAPIGSMTYIARLQQKNARAAIDNNFALKIPTAVTAGQVGGGFYGGHGGMIIGGGGWTGLGGGCPYGACQGNGGIVVGGGGWNGGGFIGGNCGLPPFAHTYVGCGGGGIVGGGGFQAGGPGGLQNWGQGPIIGGGGMWNGNPGWGVGVPGGWNGGVPGGWNGGVGAGGVGGMPGPWGTGDGSNGWTPGTPGTWNPGTNQGAPGYWGTGAPNAQWADMQAKMYQAYAAQMARQAQQSAQAAKLYKNNLKDLESVQEKAYQSYMAYQMSSMGMMGGPGGGFGGGFPGAGGGFQAGGPGGLQNWGQGPVIGGGAVGGPCYSACGGGGVYYPPYSSGGGNGLNIGFGLNYSTQGGQRRR